MHVVAIYGLKDDKEGLADSLAAVLGVTVYEALSRLRAPGSGPLIVAVVAEKERGDRLVQGLLSAEFKALILNREDIESESNALIIRKFSLGESELSVTTEKGDSFDIPFQNIGVILRGTDIFREVTTETVKKRSLSLERAVLSGGMMISKTTKSVREIATEERQGFANIYPADGTVLVFREKKLVYDSLGPELRPSRVANFNHVVSELVRRCTGALYDARLLNRAAQAALLGPSLSPEEHLIVATALLSKVLRDK